MTLILKHRNGYFVDGLFEPIDWTWGTEAEATRFEDRAALDRRLQKTPFEYGGMVSQGSVEVVEINSEPPNEESKMLDNS